MTLFPAGDNKVLTGACRHLASTRFRLGQQDGRHIDHAEGPIYTLFALHIYFVVDPTIICAGGDFVAHLPAGIPASAVPAAAKL